jgi:hypothetical protein
MTSVLGAGAAAVAAVLAGANFLQAERREQRRWVHEALVEAYVAFLDASFDLDKVARRMVNARKDPGADQEQAAAIAEADRLHTKQTETLTRLRVLASDSVVRAAETLHGRDHGVTDLSRTVDVLDDAAMEPARTLRKAARQHLIDAARRSMRLPTGVPIGHRDS